ncbi:MAG: thioredoxin domain-containing protein [Patescibacteria group bacterium]|nr:thioredoxin domain-containing protein [Patescibacteria group bacterium]MDD4304774.1 thioredoxin domain-containing protein [Patescibacteria group bacterium]MDD4695487.1 thioredoxin domain-containing protein [Patescibacteria group bacterium]
MKEKENKLLSMSVFFLIVIFFSFLIYNIVSSFKILKTKNTNEVIESITTENYVLSNFENDPVKGKLNTAVTIYLFADYELENVKNILGIIDQIILKYPDKVNFVWKDLPLPNHYFAKAAALAARCALPSEKYWEYQAKLLENQGHYSFELYKNIANELNIPLTDFLSCYQSQRYLVDIEYNINEAYVLNIKDIPAIFVNQDRYTEEINFEKLDIIISNLIK